MAIYHVDNNGADGDGSAGSPWNNIAGHVNDLSADDTMYVHGNASAPARTYTEAKINPTVNGTSANRITLCPYLSELVIIQNNAGGDHTMELDGDYWTIQDFEEIDHNGIFVYGIEIKANHVIIKDISTIHNVVNHNIVVCAGRTHTEIRDCTIHDADRSGTSQDAHGVMVGINADYTIIDGNIIYDCSGDAVQFVDSGWASAVDSPVDCEITNNTCYRGTVVLSEDGFDIKCSAGLLIADNDIEGYGRVAGDVGGGGIAIHDQTSTNLTIRDNAIHHTHDAIALGSSEDVTIRNNIVFDIEDDALLIHGTTNLDLYNNTIVDAVDNGLKVTSGGWSGGNMKNNLWVNCGDLTLDAGVTFTATAEHNGRWDTTSDADFVDAATDTTGTGDPGFVDAANDDYHLAVRSDAINAGVDVGLDYYGSAPDLGYDEYQRKGAICMIM